MSHQANGNGRAGGSLDRLVVVRVEDTIEPQLTGHTGGRYESPPQTREQAMVLVALLLGRAARTQMASGNGRRRSPADGAWSRWPRRGAGERAAGTIREHIHTALLAPSASLLGS